MQRHKAKKSLGQNFLKSELALQTIIKAGDIKNTDIVLEIGPGKGVLTELLLAKALKVIAVEKDRELLPILQEKFSEQINRGKLLLLNADILDFSISEFVSKIPLGKLSQYKIIANIPYNITGAILKKFLTEKYQPSMMVLLVQKEVAERIIARDHKESLLSLSVKSYGTPSYIMKVGARYFSPAPKVDSAIIKIDNISRDFFTKNKIKEDSFWALLHAGFAHKRKVLLGNLKTWQKKVPWEEFFTKEKVNTKIRAEDLPMTAWKKLYTSWQNLD